MGAYTLVTCVASRKPLSLKAPVRLKQTSRNTPNIITLTTSHAKLPNISSAPPPPHVLAHVPSRGILPLFVDLSFSKNQRSGSLSESSFDRVVAAINTIAPTLFSFLLTEGRDLRVSKAAPSFIVKYFGHE